MNGMFFLIFQRKADSADRRSVLAHDLLLCSNK
jgi:hypothetical protein